MDYGSDLQNVYSIFHSNRRIENRNFRYSNSKFICYNLRYNCRMLSIIIDYLITEKRGK